jgi:sulfate adenylyltransferase
MTSKLISPYGGQLVDLIVKPERSAEIKGESRDWPSWTLDASQLCQLEMLLNGAFSPLTGFMGKADAERVRSEMKLEKGTSWPEPIVLGLGDETGSNLSVGEKLALRDGEGVMLAVLHVDEVWRDDATASFCVGGRLEGLELPHHYDFRLLRLTPDELRQQFLRFGWRNVAAFQTASVMHRPQFEQSLRAIKEARANLLIHAECGAFEPDRRDDYMTVRCLQQILPHYPHKTAHLALLPFAFSHEGARDVMLQAIVARNFGCTHLIIDGARSNGKGEKMALIEELVPFEEELGVKLLDTEPPVYVDDVGAYLPKDEAPKRGEYKKLSSEEMRNIVQRGFRLPGWFTFPEISSEIQRAYPPRGRQGFTVFFTGLSGAGKSTLAKALLARLMEIGDRPVTLLDGDIVRRNLSSQLGFSREDRDLNIRRIGFVASEITKNRGIALCAPIAPYNAMRQEVRNTIEAVGGFILVHVNPPLEICEQRDRKGLYAKARAGIIPNFTGVSDPYEEPLDAELQLDTSNLAPEEAVQEIILYLEREGWVGLGK